MDSSIDHNKLWLPNIAPRKGVLLSVLVSIILILSVITVVCHQPNIGVEWKPTVDKEGLVAATFNESTLRRTETRIITLYGQNTKSVNLTEDMLIEDPDQFSTYGAYNTFIEKQQKLLDVYQQGEVYFVDEFGKRTTHTVQNRRELGVLPGSFWCLNVSAALCFLVGSGVWCYRRGEPVSRLMAITAFCYYLSILCLSVYSTRELVLNPALFLFFSNANHAFTIAWCYSLLLMFTYYPVRLGNVRTTVCLYAIATVIWINQTLQWIEIPVHTYYCLNHIVPYFVAIALGYLQWRQTSQLPIERAALRWFILSIWISIGLAGTFFIFPSVIHEYYAIPLWVPALSIFLMFVCFALGILRYGLFGLEKWWFIGWIWLATVLLLLVVDILIIMILDISFERLLPYSLLFLGWFYFPVRQWLWKRLAKPEKNRIDHHLPMLVQSLFESQSVYSMVEKWEELLMDIFQPLDLVISENIQAPVIALNNGLTLQIPGIEGSTAFQLTGNQKGSKLFGDDDIALARALLNLSQAIFSIADRTREAQRKGAAIERERIMRDLHDDLLPKIITIKQQAPNNEILRLAEGGLLSIRDTIYILRSPPSKPLEEVLADWRCELVERLELSGLSYDFNCFGSVTDVSITSLQCINLSRIMREAVSNSIQHAYATEIVVNFRINSHFLHLEIADNGIGLQKKNTDGLGIKNMRLRAKAVNANIEWLTESNEILEGVTVAVTLPLTVVSPDNTQDTGYNILQKRVNNETDFVVRGRS